MSEVPSGSQYDAGLVGEEIKSDLQIEADILQETLDLLLCPYDDDEYIKEIKMHLGEKDKEDFKRIIHAHLLSKGNSAKGWELEHLKSAVKESMGFDDVRKVDKFVLEHFKFQSFRVFIEAADDIAVVGSDGLISPFLDDSNRDLYNDAVASAKNKDEKERKKEAAIERNQEDPANIEAFYMGVNKLRRAINAANELNSEREGAHARITAKDGSEEIIVGINYNLVDIEYNKLFGISIAKDSKAICGRSTINKALQAGKPKCLVETIVIESKDSSNVLAHEKMGTYIGLRNDAREYSPSEIQAAVDACRHKNADNKQMKYKREEMEMIRRRDEDRARQSHEEGMKKELKEQMERQKKRDGDGRSAMTTQGSKGQMNMRHNADSSDESEKDLDSDAYSNDSDAEEKMKEKEREKRRKEKRKTESNKEEGVERASVQAVQALASSPPPPSPPPSRPHISAQPEVPYGQLPPAPYVLQYEDDDDDLDDEMEAALLRDFANDVRGNTFRGNERRGVMKQNAWETNEDEVVEKAPPQVQEVQQHHEIPSAPAPTKTVFGPTPILDAEYNEPVMQQQQQVTPPIPPVQQPYAADNQMQQPQYAPQPDIYPPNNLIQGGDAMQAPQYQQQQQYVQPVYPPPQQHMQPYQQQGPYIPQAPSTVYGEPLPPPLTPNPYPQPQYAQPQGAYPQQQQQLHMQQQQPYQNAPQQSYHPTPPPQQGYAGALPVTNLHNNPPPVPINYQYQPYPIPPQGGQGTTSPNQMYANPLQDNRYSPIHAAFEPTHPLAPAPYQQPPMEQPTYSNPHPVEYQQVCNEPRRGFPSSLPRREEEGGRRGEYSMPTIQSRPPQRETNENREYYDSGYGDGGNRREEGRGGRRGESYDGRRERSGWNDENEQSPPPPPQRYNPGMKSGTEGGQRHSDGRRGGATSSYTHYPYAAGQQNQLGPPRGSSTPLDRSQNLWTMFNQLDTPKKRIRWQIIVILKNIRDRNDAREWSEFEIIKMDILMRVVTAGCGNEMELYEALEEMTIEFRDFLEDMRRDGLVKLCGRGDIIYVLDPFSNPPPSMGLTRY